MPIFIETFPELKGYVKPVTRRRPKYIEPHIVAKEDGNMWGMYNERLKQWIGYDDYTESHLLFRNADEARAWYLEQL